MAARGSAAYTSFIGCPRDRPSTSRLNSCGGAADKGNAIWIPRLYRLSLGVLYIFNYFVRLFLLLFQAKVCFIFEILYTTENVL